MSSMLKWTPVPIPNCTRPDPEPIRDVKNRVLTTEKSSGTGKNPAPHHTKFRRNKFTCLGSWRTKLSPSTRPSPPPSGREPVRRRHRCSTPPWAANRRRSDRGSRGVVRSPSRALQLPLQVPVFFSFSLLFEYPGPEHNKY
jgi:hypothetical protein